MECGAKTQGHETLRWGARCKFRGMQQNKHKWTPIYIYVIEYVEYYRGQWYENMILPVHDIAIQLHNLSFWLLSMAGIWFCLWMQHRKDHSLKSKWIPKVDYNIFKATNCGIESQNTESIYLKDYLKPSLHYMRRKMKSEKLY